MAKPLSRPQRPPEQLALDLSPATNLSMASSMPAPAVAVVGGTLRFWPADGLCVHPMGMWLARGVRCLRASYSAERRA